MVSFLLQILSSGILDKLLDHYNKKDDNAAKVAVEEIKAAIEQKKVQKELITLEHGWWVTAWIRPAFVYPCVLHFVAIVLDTVFGFGWGIPSLPGMYNDLEFAIILSYFITRPIEKSVRSVFRK